MAHSYELSSNASQITITVSTALHKLHKGPLTSLFNYTHLTNHPHFVNVIFSTIFIKEYKKGCKPWELKHTIVLLWEYGKEKVICSVSTCCYCFVSSTMSSSIHIKFLFHQKTNKTICMNFRGSNKMFRILALQSSHHEPASNFVFNSLSWAKGKLPSIGLN